MVGYRGGVVALGLALLSLGLTGCDTTRWHHELVSVNGAGTGSANEWSGRGVFSPDGTKVAFVSRASDFGPTDGLNCGQPPWVPPRQCEDVYLRDLTTGTTSLVSVNAAGTDSGRGGDSTGPILSPDGTKLLFSSSATDLVAGLDAYGINVYLRDLVTETTSLVSVSAAGGTTNGDSYGMGFSPDGTKILFESWSDDLGPTDTNTFPDVYLRDLTTGTTSVVTGNAAGTVAGDRGGTLGSFSPDGSKVVFQSGSTDLGTPDTNLETDIFVRDLATGTVTLASPNATGTDGGNAGSQWPVFGPDGTQVLFQSSADDLGPVDTNTCDELSCPDIYLRDLDAGTTTLVSVDATGADSPEKGALAHSFSHDGTKVVFSSSSPDIVPGDDNVCGEGTGSCVDVLVRDLVAGTTTLVSADSTGASTGNGHSIAGAFTWDDRMVVFRSDATNLGPTDTNGWEDLYARDLSTGRTSLVSSNAAGDDAGDGGVSLTFTVAPSDDRVLYDSFATDAVATDTNQTSDVVISSLPDDG